jgi:CRISPR-associated protein Csm1
LEDVAGKSAGGRKWLGYLRLDVDLAGEHFRKLEGSPGNVRALSLLLHHFFWGEVQALIDRNYRFLYPVYGGGDDLFVIGPWDQSLDFACELSTRFSGISGHKLRFSGGLALSKPKQHILTKSDEAEALLHAAKRDGGNRLRALGVVLEWEFFVKALKRAKQVAKWHNDKHLASAFLQNLLHLHGRWEKDRGDVGYRALLHYQIERNIRGRVPAEVQSWARSLLKPESEWASIGFICRYAMLASTTNPNERGD